MEKRIKRDKRQFRESDLLGRKLRLGNLLHYQKDSIVSRQLIDRGSGSVTLFAFDKGQGLSEHVAPFDAAVYIVDGTARIAISGKPLSVKAGEMLIMPAHKPHALRAVKKFKMLLIMVRS